MQGNPFEARGLCLIWPSVSSDLSSYHFPVQSSGPVCLLSCLRALTPVLCLDYPLPDISMAHFLTRSPFLGDHSPERCFLTILFEIHCFVFSHGSYPHVTAYEFYHSNILLGSSHKEVYFDLFATISSCERLSTIEQITTLPVRATEYTLGNCFRLLVSVSGQSTKDLFLDSWVI